MAERTTYTKTVWENDITELNADNMNHIEAGIEVNNLLAKENANFIDEIFSAFISQSQLTFNSSTKELHLKFGSLVGNDPTQRFHVELITAIPIVDPVMTDEDLEECWLDDEEPEEEPQEEIQEGE